MKQNLLYSSSKRIKERNDKKGKIERNNSVKNSLYSPIDLVKTPRLDNCDNNDIC